MGEYRTRSRLLTIAERLADLISKYLDALQLSGIPEPSACGLSEHELDRHGTGAGLRALLGALRREAALSTFGAMMTRCDIAIKLATLRRFCEEEAEHPEILQQPVTRPVIITGLPRSGTTFLQALLAQDPDNQALRCWET